MTDAERGLKALSDHRYQEAELIFLSCLEREPEERKYLDGLGQALMGRRSWREAAGVFELLAEDNRFVAYAWERAAECYFHAHAHQEWNRAQNACLAAERPNSARLVTFARRLLTVKQTGDALRLVTLARRLDPDSVEVFEALASVHLAMGDETQAIRSLSTVAALAPQSKRAITQLQKLLNQRVPTWHFPMMNDVPRNQAFEEAIIARLEPGDTVLDIGCGAGLLSLIAARAGAEKVFAIEGESAVADVAEEIFRTNGYDEQIHLTRGRSTQLSVGAEISERADLLVSEIFDVSLLGEDALFTFKHAHEHLLKPNAKVIPSEARVWCALVESDELRARFAVEESRGFDLSAFNRLRDPRVLQLDLRRFKYDLLTEPTLALTLSFENEVKLRDDQVISTLASRSGRADGFIFWYDLVLAPATETRDEIVLSTSPLQANTHWLQGFTPCYGEKRNLEADSVVSFVCAYRRFLLWFDLC